MKKMTRRIDSNHKIPANNGNAKPHGGENHNNAIDDFIENIKDEAIDIRKNQKQVDFSGNTVGNNKPDVQYNKGGKHYNVEFDNSPQQSQKHGAKIKQNDSKSIIILNQL